MSEKINKNTQIINSRISSGQICRQTGAGFIKEVNSVGQARLDAVALVDRDRQYTYRQMFRCWDNYAEVFSALHMTGADHARVGILSTLSVESIMCLYALNMLGASVSMIPGFGVIRDGELKRMIEKESITDLIVADDLLSLISPVDLLPEFLKKKRSEIEDAGLGYVIVLHTPTYTSDKTCALFSHDSFRYQRYKDISWILLMEDLLEQYEATPLTKSQYCDDPSALILHTSGSTKGIPKPVPLSNQGLNEAVRRFLLMDEFSGLRGKAVTTVLYPPTSSYTMIDMIHLPLAFGGKVVILPQGIMQPSFTKEISRYGMNILFINTEVLENWMKLPEQEKPDLSSLKCIALGGTYLSADNRKRYNVFLKERGCSVKLFNGYGLTEAGGACFLSTKEEDGDAIGYPLPGVEARIYDEEKKEFRTAEEGPVKGGLYLTCPSLTTGTIDETVFYDVDEIDGVPYICTYDLVQVDEKGLFTCLGRMNRYFINEEGTRFKAGVIENRIAACEGIRACAIVPGYSKKIHDTVPVLYIKPDQEGKKGLELVRKALLKALKEEASTEKIILPEKVVTVRQIPVNANGKPDLYEITKGNLEGHAYKFSPVLAGGELKDLRWEDYEESILPSWNESK